jgi:hypothetical protein
MPRTATSWVGKMLEASCTLGERAGLAAGVPGHGTAALHPLAELRRNPRPYDLLRTVKYAAGFGLRRLRGRCPTGRGVVDVVVVDQYYVAASGQIAERPQPQVPAVQHVQGGLRPRVAGRGPVFVARVADGGQQMRPAPAQLGDQPGVGKVQVALEIQPQ